MVGQLLALMAATLTIEGEVLVGSPLCSIAARVETPWEPLSAGLELGLAGDAAALRVLAAGVLRVTEVLELHVSVGRAFAFRGVSTLEADVGLDVEIPLDARTHARLGLYALGYLGPDASQRGVVALGRVGTGVVLDGSWVLIMDLGWMASAATHRPYGAIGVRW